MSKHASREDAERDSNLDLRTVWKCHNCGDELRELPNCNKDMRCFCGGEYRKSGEISTESIKMDLFSKAHLAIKTVGKDVSIPPEKVLENLAGLQDRISIMMEVIKQEISDNK